MDPRLREDDGVVVFADSLTAARNDGVIYGKISLVLKEEAMRLTHDEIKSIIESFHNSFETGSVYLFGSRVDDARKGGDIDLYIV